MNKTLLIEIGVEELPAIPFLKELKNIEKKYKKVLKEYSLECDFEFFYTPRRLVFFHKSFPLKQPDFLEEFFGAPLEIAYKNSTPTAAAISFAKKCGVDVKELSSTIKNNKEVLYFKKRVTGQDSKRLLSKIVEEFLNSLNFGKSMRWGEFEFSFIRPIRWIVALLGDEVVDFNIFGVNSSNISYPHRAISYEPFSFNSPKEYFKKLRDGGVILDQNERRELIENGFLEIEKKEKVVIDKDEFLLNEVVAITEYPTVLMGKFDEKFLKLPNEVIITSMKEHQRYFPIFKDQKLINRFIVVANAYTNEFDLIINGNEKVLKARLSDALFFYENDLKRGLNSEGLKDVIFMSDLGSLYDKSQRELKIALYLYEKYKDKLEKNETKELLVKTINLAKADLLSEMVYEFSELQAIMGYYYAKAMGEDSSLCLAIKEQYLPDGEESTLPTTNFSAIVALANKLDTLFALFSIDKIPTGTKDPYALRRAALGVIKILHDREFNFDIEKDLKEIGKFYGKDFSQKIEEFFIERFNQFFDTNPSIIKAVLQSDEKDIVKISRKIKALTNIVKSDNFSEIFSTFKRVANIIKDLDNSKIAKVDEKLFENSYERELYDSFKAVASKKYSNYEENLKALFALKEKIDNFFDHVMVNVEDKKIKQNRKNLIATIYNAFKEIADIKEITI